MSYFSRIQLNPGHTQAREALLQSAPADTYADHQWLWKFFPAARGSARDFVFRRKDPDGLDTQPVFYAVSRRPPESPHPAWQVQTKPYQPLLRAGERLSFEVRVNPVRVRYEQRLGDVALAFVQRRHEQGLKVREGLSRRKEYDDVVMHAKRQLTHAQGVQRWADVPADIRPPLYTLVNDAVSAWFVGAVGEPGMIARYGFRAFADCLQVDAYRKHRLGRGDDKRIQFSTVDLGGVVEVTDVELAEAALRNGIGRARGFGCGLLLVRRLG